MNLCDMDIAEEIKDLHSDLVRAKRMDYGVFL